MDIVDIHEVEQRGEQWPEDQWNSQTPYPFAVEITHAHIIGNDKHSRHHDKERHATAHKATHGATLQKDRVVVVKLRSMRVGTVCKYNKEAGKHPKDIYPYNVISTFRFSHDKNVFLHPII